MPGVNPSPWVLWATAGMALGFLLVAVAANKFMLARSKVLRVRGGSSAITMNSNHNNTMNGGPGIFSNSSNNQSSGGGSPTTTGSTEGMALLLDSAATTAGSRDPSSTGSLLPYGDELECLAEEVLREREETDVDLSLVWKDGITIFYFFCTIYGLFMAVTTAFAVLDQSSRYGRAYSLSFLNFLTAIPLLFYYSIVATLSEKLFGFADLTAEGSTTRKRKKIRRVLLALLALIPPTSAALLVVLFPDTPDVVNNVAWTDIGQSAIFAILLALGGYATQTGSSGSQEQRSLCVRVSIISILFIVGRGVSVLPYFQTQYYFANRSILFQILINAATSVPVYGTMLVLRPKKSQTMSE